MNRGAKPRNKLASAGDHNYTAYLDTATIERNQKGMGTPAVPATTTDKNVDISEYDLLFFTNGPAKSRKTAGYVTHILNGEGSNLMVPGRSQKEAQSLMMMGKKFAGMPKADNSYDQLRCGEGDFTVSLNTIRPVKNETEVAAGDRLRAVISAHPEPGTTVYKAKAARTVGVSFADEVCKAFRHHAMFPDKPLGNPALNGLVLNRDNEIKLTVAMTLYHMLSSGMFSVGPALPDALKVATAAGGQLSEDEARSLVERFSVINGLIDASADTFNAAQRAQISAAMQPVIVTTDKVLGSVYVPAENVNMYFGNNAAGVNPGYNASLSKTIANATGSMIEAQKTVSHLMVASYLDGLRVYEGPQIGMALENAPANSAVNTLVNV